MERKYFREYSIELYQIYGLLWLYTVSALPYCLIHLKIDQKE